MTTHNLPVQAALLGAAATVVAAAMFALASYSDAKFEAALSATELRYGASATEVTIAPSRIEVVARRGARTVGLVSTAGAASRS